MADMEFMKNPYYRAGGLPKNADTDLPVHYVTAELDLYNLQLDSTYKQMSSIRSANASSDPEGWKRATSLSAVDVVDTVKMNQLQNLLHDALISTEHVQQCAIIRRKDCSIRASSVGFNLYQDQVLMLLDAFKNPPQTREEGIYFDDRQYKCVRADKNSIYGKCDNRGLILVKTQTMLIIATYTENMYPSVCVEAVEKLAEYFKEKGK